MIGNENFGNHPHPSKSASDDRCNNMCVGNSNNLTHEINGDVKKRAEFKETRVGSVNRTRVRAAQLPPMSTARAQEHSTSTMDQAVAIDVLEEAASDRRTIHELAVCMLSSAFTQRFNQ